MQARIMYQMPATAICWSTYEFLKYILCATSDVRIVSTPPTTVPAADSLSMTDTSNSTNGTPNNPTSPTNTAADKYNLKSRELPAMSGAGLYGSISFNTMHESDYSKKDSMLDWIHT